MQFAQKGVAGYERNEVAGPGVQAHTAFELIEPLSQWSIRDCSHMAMCKRLVRGCSSTGRAPASHAGGTEIDARHLHTVLLSLR